MVEKFCGFRGSIDKSQNFSSETACAIIGFCYIRLTSNRKSFHANNSLIQSFTPQTISNVRYNITSQFYVQEKAKQLIDKIFTLDL